MPKYKVGDKVKVVSDLGDGRYRYYMERGDGSDCANDEMKEFRGKVVTITEASDWGYRVKENRWHWVDEMFSGSATPTAQYHVGDKVLVRSDLDDLHAPAMRDLAGHEVTIVRENVVDVCGSEPGYAIKEDDEMWVWHDSDFAGAAFRRVAVSTPVTHCTSPGPHPTANPFERPATTATTETKIQTKKESHKMKLNLKNILKQYMPRAINDGSVALSISGDIAYRRKDGDYVFYDPDSRSINNCMDLVLGSAALDKMVFVMPTKDIHVGDVVLNNSRYIYVTNITEAGIKGVSLESGRTATLVKEVNTVMGFCPYAKVTSLFTMMTGRGGETGFNPMYLALLGDSDSEDDLFTTIAMMTMLGGGAATATAAPAGGLFGGGMNPLMLLALSGGDDDGDGGLLGGGLTKLLLLSQMSGGGLFQFPTAPATAANPAEAGGQA